MKVYVFLADGFEETEALTPWDLLIRAGADVVTVSINDTDAVTGTHGLRVHADVVAAGLPAPAGEFCVVLPGGMPGAKNLDECPAVDAYLRHAYAHGHVAAICAAPFVLGKRGYTDGREATCFPGFEKDLLGARLSGRRVVTDGNVTTARGMGVAFDFGCELIRVLFGERRADEVRRASQANA